MPKFHSKRVAKRPAQGLFLPGASSVIPTLGQSSRQARRAEAKKNKETKK